MSEGILTVLKFCFIALLYLFLIRVVRVVTLELRAAPLKPVESAPPAVQRTRDRRALGGKEVQLRMLEPASVRGQVHTVDSEVTVGRAGGCGIVLVDDTYVSSVHARVFWRDNDVYVEDLGSTNGTFVNGTRISSPTRVKRGDRIQFGQSVAELVK